MPAYLNAALDRIRNFWLAISMAQRLMLGLFSVILIATFFGLVVWLNTPDFQVLYSKLGPEDAHKVVSSLQAQKIPYKLENGGTVILVPADEVYSQRVRIAGEGGMVGQGIGFEIFNDLQVGVTDYVQKINYQRALQGELARTILAFPTVESARVHLVMPQKSLFIEEQQKPSASVVLKLASGNRLEGRDVMAIVNLLTMSVEGLDKSRVSIADSSGKVLYQPTEEDSSQMSSTQLEHKNLTQASLERRIEELLMPIVGPGKVIAKVNAELDYSQKTIRKELYDPDSAVLRSEQRSEQSTMGQTNLEGGVPEPNFRGDGMGGSAATQSSSSETRSSNYEINREEQNIIAPIGEINRLSVAVVVDGYYNTAEDGTTVFTPRSEDEIRQIRQLVSNAVGFNSSRGDSIEVSSISFGADFAVPDKNMGEALTEYAVRLGKPLLNALLVLLFLIMVVRPVVLALIRPRVEGEMLEALEGLPSGEDRLALVESTDDTVEALAALEKIEDIKASAIQLSEQNMEQALGIIRSWLQEPEKAKSL